MALCEIMYLPLPLLFFLSLSAHPVRRRISAWGCGAVTMGVWLLSLALAAPPSLYTRYLDLRPSGIDLVVCEEFWPNSGNLRLLYSCFILIASYMIPLLSVSVSYCAITVSLKRYSVPGEPSNSQQRWSQRRKRTFSLLVASVLAFALCWLPLQVSLRSRLLNPKLNPNSEPFLGELSFSITPYLNCSLVFQEDLDLGC